MTCENALAWMLEAEPDDLETPVDPGVAEHLRACSTCGDRLEAVRTGQEWLSRELDALGDAFSPDRALALARSGLPPAGRVRRPASGGGRASRWPAPGARRAYRWLWPAAAAAAVLAGLLLVEVASFSNAGPGDAPIRTADPAVPGESDPATLSVEVAEGDRPLILATRNPSITVVWFP